MRKERTNDFGICNRCGEAVAFLVSRTKGTRYAVRLVIPPTGEIVNAAGMLVGVADFHKCSASQLVLEASKPGTQKFLGVAAFFQNTIRNGSKRFTVSITDETKVRVQFSYSTSRNVVYVSNGGAFGTPENIYYGAIDLTTGALRPSANAITPLVGALIAAFDRDPIATAVASAKITGACSFCSRTLTDARSISVGYGPTCADTFSLPWGNKAA